MNSLSLKSIANRIMIAIMMLMTSVVTFAQDKKVDVDINTKGDSSNFFASPWVWIIGVAVFILLLVALMRPARRDA